MATRTLGDALRMEVRDGYLDAARQTRMSCLARRFRNFVMSAEAHGRGALHEHRLPTVGPAEDCVLVPLNERPDRAVLRDDERDATGARPTKFTAELWRVPRIDMSNGSPPPPKPSGPVSTRPAQG
jgi:hypothetical protein